MSGDAGQNRTEKPTPRRRERARREGDVAYSSDLTAAAGLAALAMLVQSSGPLWARGLGNGIESAIRSMMVEEWTFTHTCGVARWVGIQLLVAAGLVSVAVISLTTLTGLMQSGMRISPQTVQFKWDKLFSPQALSRLWSVDSLVKTLTVLLKLAVLTLVATIAASQQLQTLHALKGHAFAETVAVGAAVASRVFWSAAAAALAIGVADYGWQIWRREKRLKMSKEELKQEQKDDSGDPHQKAQFRKRARELSQRKGLRDVPQATVILTNPTHFAVALKYDRNSSGAPTVIAKGSDALARQIVRIARKNGVPVLERKPLTRALYKYVPVGKEIPAEFYQTVAEILAFLYRQRSA